MLCKDDLPAVWVLDEVIQACTQVASQELLVPGVYAIQQQLAPVLVACHHALLVTKQQHMDETARRHKGAACLCFGSQEDMFLTGAEQHREDECA